MVAHQTQAQAALEDVASSTPFYIMLIHGLADAMECECDLNSNTDVYLYVLTSGSAVYGVYMCMCWLLVICMCWLLVILITGCLAACFELIKRSKVPHLQNSGAHISPPLPILIAITRVCAYAPSRGRPRLRTCAKSQRWISFRCSFRRPKPTGSRASRRTRVWCWVARESSDAERWGCSISRRLDAFYTLWI